MEELNKLFEEYMENVKKLPTNKKRIEVINSIKELIAIFEGLATIDNISLEYLKNREINDLNKEQVTEDDFLEAELVYIEIAKNIIGQYLIQKIN